MIIKRLEWLNFLKDSCLEQNYLIDEVNLFGIRFENDQNKDIWNDILGIWTKHNVYCWPGTTDPGKHATEEQKGGAAHLCLGYHKDIWMKGIHAESNPNFAHLALRQLGNAVKIWRDVNRNYENDENIYEEGYFGINWHRASKLNNVPVIGNYAAGCQVTLDVKDFEFALNLILNTEKFKKDHNCKFSYMLFSHEVFGL